MKKTPPKVLARYYDTLDLADQALKNSGNSAKKVLLEALKTKKFTHIVEGKEVVRTLSVTDTTAILDALTHYDNKIK